MTIQPDETGRYPVVRTAPDGGRRLPEGTRILVLRRDKYRCVFCGSGGRLEVDHIIPWSAGGSDDMDNLRTLCHRCNQERSNFRVPADDERRLPTAHQCVYCTSALLGERLVSVYCVQCNKKAPGIPRSSTWHPDVDLEPGNCDEYQLGYFNDQERVDLDEVAEKYRAAAIATIRKALASEKPNA